MFPSNLGKSTNFPNMAGRKDCDEFIAKELEQAGIFLEKEKSTGEVPYHIIGRIGGFTFKRAWYYWKVDGDVPLPIAIEMFNDPIGNRDVRVAGYAGNTDPLMWAEYRDERGYIYRPICPAQHDKPHHEQKWFMYKKDDEFDAVMHGKGKIHRPDLSNLAGFITGYHIDSQSGLDYFVATLKKHGVIS